MSYDVFGSDCVRRAPLIYVESEYTCGYPVKTRVGECSHHSPNSSKPCMTTNTTEGIQSYSHETDGSIREIVTSFVDEVADALVQAGASQNAVQAVQESGEGLASSVEQIEEDTAQAHSRARKAEARVDELEAELKDERETRAKESAEDRQRIHRVEERITSVEEGGSSGATPTPEAGKTALHKPETPLERVCAFDEETADRELTANQSRARFIARDLTDYADSVPAGYAIRSGDIATVLRAGTDCRGRTQTVARVMDFLSDLGGEGVEIVERRGTKRVVFGPETTRRLEQISSNPSAADNTVVMSREV